MRGDGAEVLELIEEALDEIAFAIEYKVARPLGRTVGVGRDDRGDPALDEGIDEGIGVVCPCRRSRHLSSRGHSKSSVKQSQTARSKRDIVPSRRSRHLARARFG
jgi:hypothetical protein